MGRHDLGPRLTRLALAASLLAARPATGLAADHPGWLAGEDLARQRQQPVSLTWSGVPLREAVASLSKAQRIAVLLDRRIDPGQRIDITCERKPFDAVLEEVAGKIDSGLTWLGPLAYIGPKGATSRLRTLAASHAAEVRALGKEKRAAFQRQARFGWEALAEPRSLAAELASETNAAIEPLELIGHDLWPTADLPPLSWTDRLTLITNEFDLTFEIVDGAHLRLVPVTGPVVLERVYPGGKQPEALAAKWASLAPNAQIEVARGKIVVRGTLEDHELLSQGKKSKPVTTSPGVDLYTLRVQEQPLSAVLDTLRARTSHELVVDDAALQQAKRSVDVRVSFSVEQATFDELLAAVLKPAGLTFRREGKAYRIVPSP